MVALMSSHSLVHTKDLSKKFFYETKPEMTKELELEDEGAIKNMVDEFEKNLLIRYLRKYHWNKSKVAKLCGITRQGLNKKISKYRLDRRK
jgi:transcriptional regulator with PAS, ATPase and Fis domain